MLPLLRQMRAAVGPGVGLIAQPAAFQTSDEVECFTRLPQFPDDLETIQVTRRAFRDFARGAADEGIKYLGGCCGCNAAYVRAMALGLAEARAASEPVAAG
jgi:betaine-homocysteine S-methyltransferase